MVVKLYLDLLRVGARSSRIKRSLVNRLSIRLSIEIQVTTYSFHSKYTSNKKH